MPTFSHTFSLLDAAPPTGSSPEALYAARDALDAKLAALEDFVADARARLFDARSTVVNELRALRLSALPREVFSIIFTFTLDGDARPSKLKAPLVLLEVCRLWRDVALSTPQLWAELVWTLSKKNGKEQNNLADWVARAGGLSRRLTVAPSVPSLPRSEVAVSKRLFDALVSFPISDLHLASELSATVQSRIFKACTSSFSTLQRLSIRGTPLLVSEINLCFQSLSKLTLTSDWDSTMLPLDLKVEQAPFTTLTFLEIQPAISYTTFGRIILHCTALGNLAVCVQTTEDVIVRPRELLHVRLVQLRLCLEEHGNSELDQQAADDQRDFLKRLRFPSLRSISLQLIDGELTSSWEDGICEGIFSHCPHLDSLSWDMEKYDNRDLDFRCPTPQFVDALQLVPNITTLSLVFEHRVALMHLFRLLDGYDSAGQGILPRLQVLRIHINENGEREMRTHLDDSAPFSWNRIVKFLTRRKETMRVLELRLAECGGKLHSATMPSEVQDLIGCGMLQLVVEYEDLDAEYSDLESEYHETLYAARDALDAKIAALEEFVAGARSRLFEARSTVVNELRALRLAALPREVLSIIFTFTLDGHTPSKLKSPLLLLEVCRLWRDVALSTPQLWVEVLWTLTKKNGKRQKNLAAWVARAGGLGRRLTIVVIVSKRLSQSLASFPISSLDLARGLAHCRN
ncbi:F-box domain-containing protein [Mycena chlorophos]|uniref:F-box domain-containing protein n=1 Tax=Mycena chlorophos TaxID=658473 RepID=A0A8H6S5U2_MYCCL|nr:F-box domain-containing protein [Mycena chlorophos]